MTFHQLHMVCMSFSTIQAQLADCTAAAKQVAHLSWLASEKAQRQGCTFLSELLFPRLPCLRRRHKVEQRHGRILIFECCLEGDVSLCSHQRQGLGQMSHLTSRGWSPSAGYPAKIVSMRRAHLQSTAHDMMRASATDCTWGPSHRGAAMVAAAAAQWSHAASSAHTPEVPLASRPTTQCIGFRHHQSVVRNHATCHLAACGQLWCSTL
jgi:hypothetical protein